MTTVYVVIGYQGYETKDVLGVFDNKTDFEAYMRYAENSDTELSYYDYIDYDSLELNMGDHE